MSATMQPRAETKRAAGATAAAAGEPPRVDRGTKSAADDPRGPTYCERHRHECEVRTVAEWDGDRRRDYLALVEKRRGAEAAHRLRDDVARLLNARVRRRAEAQRTVECRADLFGGLREG